MRNRPTVLHYAASYNKVADELVDTRKAGRKSKAELILEQVLAHNKRETVRSSKIKTDEIAALKNVVMMSLWADSLDGWAITGWIVSLVWDRKHCPGQ